ncbi:MULTISPECIES: DUF2322 family protein [unclassified Duganella]|jgi:hypothetical protein|uniref:DUF2322 family protein n=1 Tax=unclassified Duganella TaxID=2636909 RepID=UPI00088A39B8|nr:MULTISPECIES: DUF2322 family protein [unclassified Duganella]SDF45588.1 hypothetical protein SAMN05216320_101258 [Duganella sp. OV458]SDI81189.1 hypothetical protein SAMN05428973_1011165 [Duganella sp. OV510]
MQRPNFSDKFSDNLALLPVLDTVAAIELVDHSGASVAKIENKPGQAGSLRVYCWLAETLGAVTPEAAAIGLTIYAEHTQDARANPGKHPNIDRLFNIKTPDQTLQVKGL